MRDLRLWEWGLWLSSIAALLFLLSAPAYGQLLPTNLPTPQGGDFGNGASSGSVAGGIFLSEDRLQAIPAVAHGIPLGFGAQRGQVFGAMGIQRGLRGDPDWIDAAVFAGQGFGNREGTLGVEVTVASYSTYRNTLRNRSVSVQVHRLLQPGLGLAAGVENALIAGRPDGGRSAYVVTTYHQKLSTSRSVTLTAGLGNGRFNSVQRVQRETNKASAFGSIGIRVARPVSVLATWNGQDLTLGASLALQPVLRVPVVVTPVLLDVTGYAGDRPRLALSIGSALTLW